MTDRLSLIIESSRITMNRNLYRTIFSKRLGMLVPVAEGTKAQGKGSGGGVADGGSRASRRSTVAQSAGLALACMLSCKAVFASPPLPTGGSVTAGSGTIQQSGPNMSIDQASQQMAIDWQSFSIGKDNTVTFNQPSASAVALNRVIGSDVSTIQGALRANGQVFLLNPNGVLFTPSAQVNVSGLVASTLELSNEDFLKGNFRFGGTSAAQVTNQGAIRAAEGGYVALIAAQVVNTGSIEALQGQVLLAAGRRVTLDLGGPAKLEVDEAALDALIEQGGAIRVDGGTVLLTARAAGDLARTVINHTGVIEAQSLTTGEGGVIKLLGGTDNGRVEVAGRLDASSAAGTGGHIEVTGRDVAVGDGALLDASGARGGGEVLVGGSWQNSDPGVAQATTVSVAETATLRADATLDGDGGTVVVWADVLNKQSVADVKGSLSARGGANGGNGGRIETSAATLNIGDTVRVAADAPHGAGGEWLLDPADVIITNDTADGAFGGGNPNTFTPASGAAASTVDAATIISSLNAGTSVTIQTTNTGTAGAGNGDIFVNADISKTINNNSTTLTLRAERNIEFNANVTATIGRLSVVLMPDIDNNGSGSVLFNPGSSVVTNNGNFYLGNVSGDSVSARGQHLTMLGDSFINVGNGTVDIRVTGDISLAEQSIRTTASAGRRSNSNSLMTGSNYMRLETNASTGSILSTNPDPLLANIVNASDLILQAGTIGTSGNRIQVQGMPPAATPSRTLSVINHGTGGTFAHISNQLFGNINWTTGGATSGTQDLQIANGLAQFVAETDGAGNMSVATGGIDTSGSLVNVTINTPNLILENGAIDTAARSFTANVTSIRSADGSNNDQTAEINSTQQISLIGSTLGTLANPVEFSGSGILHVVNTSGPMTYLKSVDGGHANINFTTGRTPGHHEILFFGGDHIVFDTTVDGITVPTIGPNRSDGTTFNEPGVSGIDLTGGNRNMSFALAQGGMELDDTSVNLGSGAFTVTVAGSNGDGPGAYIRSVQDYDPLDRVPQITAGNVSFIVQATTAGSGLIGGGGKDVQIAQGAGTSNNTLTLNLQRADANIHELTENHFKTLDVTLNQTSSGTQTIAIDLEGPDDVNFSDDGERVTIDGTSVNLSANNRNWRLSAPQRTIQIDGTSLSTGFYTVHTTDFSGGQGIFLNGDILTNGGNIDLHGSTNTTGKGIKLMRSVRIDSNADDLSNSTSTGSSGSINLTGRISSTGGENTLTVDSSSSTTGGGHIVMGSGGAGTHTGGTYVTGITLTSEGTTNDGTIWLQGGTYQLNGDFLSTGNTRLDTSTTIDTEQGNVGSAGNITFAGRDLTSPWTSNNLVFDTSTTAPGANGGHINLAGTATRSTLNGRTITATTTGGAGGTSGDISLPGVSFTANNNVNTQNYTGNIITLYGNLTSQRGAITLNGDVQLANSVIIDTWLPLSPNTTQTGTAGAVTINGAVSATEAGRTLTIDAGTDTGGGYFNSPTNTTNWTHSGGAVTVSTGNAGGHYLQSLTVNTAPAGTQNVGATAGAITLNGVATTGNATFTGGATTIAGDLRTNGGNIDLSGVASLTLANGPILIETDMAGGSNAAGSLNLGAHTLNGAQALTIDTTADGGGAHAALTLNAIGNTTPLASLNVLAGTLTANGAITAAGPITMQAVGSLADLILNAPVTATAAGADLVLAAGRDFINNNALDTGLNAGAGGQYFVYSTNPADSLEGMTGYSKRYNQGYTAGVTPDYASSGNWFLYSFAPQLLVTPGAQTITYGDAVPTFNVGGYSGYIDGDTDGGISGTATFSHNGVFSSTSGFVNVGAYDVTYTGGLASSLGYIVVDAAASTGELIVDPRAVSIVAPQVSRVYDGTTDAVGSLSVAVGTPLVSGDSFSGGSLAFTDANAGTDKTVVASGGTIDDGNGGANYAITYVDNTTSSIDRAQLTVTAVDHARIYDGTGFSGGNGVTYDGFVAGEDESALGGTLVFGGSSQGATNAGEYVITAGGLTAGNYTITFEGGTLTITPRALTVTATDAGKIYDGVVFTGGNGVSYDGFAAGEDESVLGGTLVFGGSSQGARDAGNYVITADGLTSSNYDITFEGGALTITPRALTVTANDAAKTYDGVAFSGGNGVSYDGFVAGEDAGVLGGTLSFGGSAQGATNAGTYAITAEGLTSGNYTITFENGTLTVDPRALTVTANDAGKIYDGIVFSGHNGVSYEGFVAGEDASVLDGTLAFGGSAQGAMNAGTYGITIGGLTSDNYVITFQEGTLTISPKALTVAVNDAGKTYDGLAFSGHNGVSYDGFVAGEDEGALGGTLVFGGSSQGATNAGEYAITASGLSADNYAITFENGTLTIAPRALTVAASDAGKVYDGIAFTGGNGVSYDGFVAGEDEGALGGTLVFGGSAQGARNAGTYAITVGGLTSGNYAITFEDGTLVVSPRPISVSAHDASRRSDDNSPFTFDVGGAGLVAGDTVPAVFTGGLESTAGRGATPGTYNIVQGTLTTNGNYAITEFNEGTLEVTASQPLDTALGIVQNSTATLGMTNALGPVTSAPAGLGPDVDSRSVGGLRIVQVRGENVSAETVPAVVPRQPGVLNVFAVNGAIHLPATLMEDQE